jgi:ribose-phosphate pyrophosphokinase
MTAQLLIAMPGNERLAAELATALGFGSSQLETRQFPDGETYLRFLTSLERQSVALVCTLDHPNDKILPLILSAATARELGASKVALISPYLAYMRQDRQFKPGEAVTSRQVAQLLSNAFDWLVTVDPHLHRYSALGEIYTIPTRVVHAAPLISQWINANVTKPLIIGPDAESEQWVAAVAKDADAPYSVLRKVRHGDRDVEITLNDLRAWNGHTPVLVDDIISSGRTMIEAVKLLIVGGWARPICIAVHGLFADRSDILLEELGARVVTSNSVPHRTNGIDVGSAVAAAIRELSATLH